MKNQIIKGKCIDLNSFGLGVVKNDGYVIFVKEMAPGDEALIKITKDQKSYAYAVIEKMLEEGPNRIESDCPIAYKCGGCNLRFLKYECELEYKRKYVQNILKDYPIVAIHSCETERYRNKMQVPVVGEKMGFYRSHSHDPVDFDDCLLHSKLSNQILSLIKEKIKEYGLSADIRHIFIRHFPSTKQVMVAIIANKPEVDGLKRLVDDLKQFEEIKSVIFNYKQKDDNTIIDYSYPDQILYGKDYIEDDLNDLILRVPFKSFYQVNREVMLKIYDKIRQYVIQSGAKKVLELYSGIGSIGLYIADACKEVYGVEIVKDSAEIAKTNARINQISNYQALLSDAKDGIEKHLKDKDLVIVDPPRKGLSIEVINGLVNSDIKHLIYVSCNPNTLNRDLNLLKEGGFKVGDPELFDMFKRTVHIETLCHLYR